MPLSSLPAVLIQLVCQQLELHSLLSFAQCCRDLHAAASSSFAWSQLPPVSICSTQPELGSRLNLRFCPRVMFVMLGAEASDDTPVAKRWKAPIAFLSSLPQLYGLDIVDRCPMPLSKLVSAAPAIRSLRVLHLPKVVVEDSSLADLVALTELSLTCHMSTKRLHSLQQLPELRVLSLNSLDRVHHPVREADLTALSNCTRLEQLTVKRAYLPQLPCVLTARMLQLESLTLVEVGFGDGLDGWARCLNAPPKLRSFSLYAQTRFVELVKSIAAAVDPAGPLRHLLFHAMAPIDPLSAELLVEDTRALMQRLPLLERFELSLSRSLPIPACMPNSDGEYAERCLDLHLTWNTKASIDGRIAAQKRVLEFIAAVDRQRVFVVEAPVILGALEREEQHRARIKARTTCRHDKQKGRCVVM